MFIPINRTRSVVYKGYILNKVHSHFTHCPILNNVNVDLALNLRFFGAKL
jgi:hypothetical protein